MQSIFFALPRSQYIPLDRFSLQYRAFYRGKNILTIYPWTLSKPDATTARRRQPSVGDTPVVRKIDGVRLKLPPSNPQAGPRNAMGIVWLERRHLPSSLFY